VTLETEIMVLLLVYREWCTFRAFERESRRDFIVEKAGLLLWT
jgi:hypothetical protein